MGSMHGIVLQCVKKLFSRNDHHILKEPQFQFKTVCLVIMVLCLIVECGTRTGKAHTHRKKVKLFSVPRVITNQGEHVEGITSTRRRKWISAISRADLTAERLESERVCGKHFVSGQPSKQWDRFSVDWVPTLNLGHSKTEEAGTCTGRAERAERTARRQKHCGEHVQRDVVKKVKMLESSESRKCELEKSEECSARARTANKWTPRWQRLVYAGC